MQGKRLDDDQRGRVVALLREGKHGRNAIARQAGVSTMSVTRIAREVGIEPAGLSRNRVKQLLEVAQAYTHERRLHLYNRAMARADAMLEEPGLTPRELQCLVTSMAIAQDKVRVELGEEKASTALMTNVIVYVPTNGRGENPPPSVTPVIDVQSRYLPANDDKE